MSIQELIEVTPQSENQYSKEIINLPDTVVVTLCWSGNHNSKPFSYYLDAFETTAKLLKSQTKAKLYLPEIEDKLETILELYKIYKPEIYNLVLDNIITPDKKFKFIRPPHIKAKTIIFVDGCLPSKGYIETNNLILLLVSNNFWWAKNIKLFNIPQLRSIEIYYDDNIGMGKAFKINVNDLKKLGEEFYKEFNKEPLVSNNNPKSARIANYVNIKYLNGYKRNINFDYYNFVSPTNPKLKISTYVYGENRNLFHYQNIYKKDMYRVLKNILQFYIKKERTQSGNLSILGWEPLYSLQDKIYYTSNKHNLKERITNTRKQGCIFAGDFEEYLNIGMDTLVEVEIIPECDLPIENFLDFDYYIYLPTLQIISDKVISTEITSRILQECIHYNKLVIVPEFIFEHIKLNNCIMNLINILDKKNLLNIFKYEE